MNDKNKALVVDFVLLTIVALAGEAISMYAVNNYYTGYQFSIAMLIAFIIIFRWGHIGTVTAILVGLVTAISLEEATLSTYIVYIVGNGAIIIASFALDIIKRERVLEHPYWGVVYVLVGFAGIVLGRGILTAILGQISFVSALFLVFANETLNLIAVALLLALLTKQKTLLIDIKQKYDE